MRKSRIKRIYNEGTSPRCKGLKLGDWQNRKETGTLRENLRLQKGMGRHARARGELKEKLLASSQIARGILRREEKAQHTLCKGPNGEGGPRENGTSRDLRRIACKESDSWQLGQISKNFVKDLRDRLTCNLPEKDKRHAPTGGLEFGTLEEGGRVRGANGEGVGKKPEVPGGGKGVKKVRSFYWGDRWS